MRLVITTDTLVSLTVSFSRLRIVAIALVGAAVLWSCTSSTDADIEDLAAVSPTVPVLSLEIDGPTEGRFLTLLEKLPSLGKSPFDITLNDFTKFREIKGLEVPSEEAGEEELLEYLLAFYDDFKNSPFPLEELPALTDASLIEFEPFVLKPFLGFDFRDVDSTAVLDDLRLVPTGDYQIIQGAISASLATELLASCADCAPHDIRTHLDTEYRAWENPRRPSGAPDTILPPVLGRQLLMSYLLIEDGHVLLTRENDRIEELIEVLKADRASMADEADLVALVDGLDAMEAAAIVISSPGVDLDEVLGAADTPNYEMRKEFTLRAPLLKPYSVAATGVGADLEGPFSVIALLHDDEDAAQENAARLPNRVSHVIRPNGTPWADSVQSMEITVRGRILFARVRPQAGNFRPIVHGRGSNHVPAQSLNNLLVHE